MRAVRALPDNWKWATGAHTPDSKGCIMEASAYVAGEPWSDHPKCVDPALTAYCIHLWDDGTEAVREQMKLRLPRLLDTAGDRAKTHRRMFIAADWAVRVFAKVECPPVVDTASALVAEKAAWAAVAARAARAAVAAVAARAARAAGEAWAAVAAWAARAAVAARAEKDAITCLDAMIEAKEPEVVR